MKTTFTGTARFSDVFTCVLRAAVSVWHYRRWQALGANRAPFPKKYAYWVGLLEQGSIAESDFDVSWQSAVQRAAADAQAPEIDLLELSSDFERTGLNRTAVTLESRLRNKCRGLGDTLNDKRHARQQVGEAAAGVGYTALETMGQRLAEDASVFFQPLNELKDDLPEFRESLIQSLIGNLTVRDGSVLRMPHLFEMYRLARARWKK